MNDRIHGVAVPARLISFPISISSDARTHLQRLVGEDGVPLNALYTLPLPDDHAGWMAVKAAADRQYAAAVKGIAGTLRSSVETIQTTDATIHVATPETVVKPDCAYLDFHPGEGPGRLGRGEATGQVE